MAESIIKKETPLEDLSASAYVDTHKFEVNTLEVYKQGNMYLLKYNLTCKEAFSSETNRAFIHFKSPIVSANIGAQSVGMHLNSNGGVKGIMRVFSTSSNTSILTQSNAVVGDYFQGELVFTL